MKKEVLKSLKTGILGLISILAVNFVSAFSFGQMLNDWNNMDVFSLLLPFLLVFALVYAILEKSKILGDNNGPVVIIALALGLLSLFSPFPQYLMGFSPLLGIGLVVLLAGIILMGFMKGEGKIDAFLPYVLFGLGAVIFLVIVSSSFSGNSIGFLNLWDNYGSAIVTLLIIIGLIALVVKWKK